MNDDDPKWFFQLCDALQFVLGFFRKGRKDDVAGHPGAHEGSAFSRRFSSFRHP